MPQLKIPSARHPQMPEDQSVRVTITDAWGHIQYESVVTPVGDA